MWPPKGNKLYKKSHAGSWLPPRKTTHRPMPAGVPATKQGGKTMKKIIALLLAVVMILGLAACAGSSSTSASTPAADSAAASSAGTASASASASSAGSQAASASASTGKDGGFVIGFSNYNNEISWRTQMEAEFTNYADTLKQQGVISNYYVYEANGDQAKQISDIQDLITMGVDAIVLPTITSDGLNDVLQEAMDEGIIVVNFDNNCSLDVNCKLTVSDYNHGQVSGDWLADQLIANIPFISNS
jgi:ribose transport system substrate-binding protein